MWRTPRNLASSAAQLRHCGSTDGSVCSAARNSEDFGRSDRRSISSVLEQSTRLSLQSRGI